MSPVTGPDIVVIGSVNLDLVVTVPTLPQPGETVLATSYDEFVGGKGSNQAIAAARLGRRVAFVGRTGGDAAGDAVRQALANEGVDVSQLGSVQPEKTGRAFVQVDERAENSIIVAGGANAHLSADDVDAAADYVRNAAVVVAQLEVPLDAVRAAGRLAGGTFVFNPAPARRLDADLLGLVDVLVVNEGEFEVVTGHPASDDADAMASAIAQSGLPGSAVVTLGARGALVWHDGALRAVPAPVVEAVDTTGAGDTFVGALADALARGESLLKAAQWAVCAASLSTLSLGATTAMPRSAEVAELLAKTEKATAPDGDARLPLPAH